MSRDQNLLFGVFAVQLGKISPQQLAAAAAAWATDPTSSLGERLVAEGAMGQADCELIAGFVDQAVQAHGGDPEQTLAAFGGQAKVVQSFAGTIAPTDSGGVATLTQSDTSVQLLGEDSIPGVIESPGRYTLRSEYARGGMGRVLLVHDEHLGREVALKELLPEIARHGSDSDTGTPVRKSMPMIARFLQEAKITGQLEHPSIVPVYELGTRTDGSIYYTMKLVRGKTLSHAISEADGLQGRLGLLSHFVDLCNAIAYAHSRGVIHRDLKPGNVMVGEFGETVVLDWGLAKTKGQPDQHADGYAETLRAMNMGDEVELAKTQYGQALGTPMYMPPEQATGDLDNIDERSDVYSLGAILYEILTGHPPHTGNSLASILKHVTQDTPRRVKDFATDAPEELIAITMKALKKKPRNRYESAGEVAQDIERFQSGLMVSAYQYGAFEQIQRFYRRHKAIAGTALIAVFVLVLATGIYIQQLSAANIETKAALETAEEERAAAEQAAKAERIALQRERSAREEAEAAHLETLKTEAALVAYMGELMRAAEQVNNRLGRMTAETDKGERIRLYFRPIQHRDESTTSNARTLLGKLQNSLADTNVFETVFDKTQSDFELELSGQFSAEGEVVVGIFDHEGKVTEIRPADRPQPSFRGESSRHEAWRASMSVTALDLAENIFRNYNETSFLRRGNLAIDITYPEALNDRAYRHNIIPVRGIVTSDREIREITVNGLSVFPRNVVLPENEDLAEGELPLEFNRRVPLLRGNNDIEISAVDIDGRRVTEKISVLADFPTVDDPNVKMPLAVLDMLTQGDDGQYSRHEGLLSSFEIALQNRFQVVDRSSIDAVLQEQGLSAVELASNVTRINLGEIVASKFHLLGEIHRFEDSLDQLVVRLTNSEEATLYNFDASIDDIENGDSIKRAVQDIVAQLEAHFPRVTGEIRQAKGNRIIADFPQEFGVQSRSYLVILKVIEEEFIDDATGEVLLEAKYGVAGRAKITRIQGNNAMADVVELEEGFNLESGIPVITW